MSEAKLTPTPTAFHTTGLTPSQLVERVKELEGALRKYEAARGDMFTFFWSNGIFNRWGKQYDCTQLNEAHATAVAALAKSKSIGDTQCKTTN